MESEARIRAAKKVIRRFLSEGTKRHSRIHTEALDDASQRLRALDGLCGNCENLTLNFLSRGGKETVATHCLIDLNPLALYRSVPLGEVASCPEFSKSEVK